MNFLKKKKYRYFYGCWNSMSTKFKPLDFVQCFGWLTIFITVPIFNSQVYYISNVKVFDDINPFDRKCFVSFTNILLNWNPILKSVFPFVSLFVCGVFYYLSFSLKTFDAFYQQINRLWYLSYYKCFVLFLIRRKTTTQLSI